MLELLAIIYSKRLYYYNSLLKIKIRRSAIYMEYHKHLYTPFIIRVPFSGEEASIFRQLRVGG